MIKTLKIEGMMCGHCEMTVKKALEKLEGVSSAEVSHEKGEAVVRLDADVDDAILRKAVEKKDQSDNRQISVPVLYFFRKRKEPHRHFLSSERGESIYEEHRHYHCALLWKRRKDSRTDAGEGPRDRLL